MPYSDSVLYSVLKSDFVLYPVYCILTMLYSVLYFDFVLYPVSCILTL